MKVEMIKAPGGVLVPANDGEVQRLTKFKTGGQYEIQLVQTRNPDFHRKVFAFFKFCFEYWKSDREFMDEKGQFEVFRNHLTVVAGYYTEFYNLKGEVRIEAKSLSYANMEQDEFEACYQSLVAAAMRTIFPGCGVDVENQLLSFF